MNPKTNKFEKLNIKDLETRGFLGEIEFGLVLRPNGKPVPKHWSIFKVDENYVINNYTFKCKYIGETSILFEPVGPIVIGENKNEND